MKLLFVLTFLQYVCKHEVDTKPEYIHCINKHTSAEIHVVCYLPKRETKKEEEREQKKNLSIVFGLLSLKYLFRM